MSTNAQATIGSPVEVLTDFGTMRFQYVGSDEKQGVLVSSAKPLDSPVPVRIHSSCVFSESLGAIDCDCALQLQMSVEIVANEGGYVLYTYEEGRGAGLAVKFEAIGIQQQSGTDTVTAFKNLGLPSDLRNYEFAAAVLLQVVGELPIELLTNDPRKVAELRARGLTVVKRRPLVTDAVFARRYLEDKARVLGHLIVDDQIPRQGPPHDS